MHVSAQKHLMNTPISFPRLVAAMFFAAVVAAFTLALALHFMAQGAQPLVAPTVAQFLGMSLFFTFFTMPVTAVFALPFGWVWQRFGPIRVGWCALLGAVSGLVGGYGLLLLTFMPTVRWESAIWFGLGGAAAGLAVGSIMGSGRLS